MEAAPTHPMVTATAASEFGSGQQNFMKDLHRISFLIALSVDGVMDGDEGGQVTLNNQGRLRFNYPISNALKESFQAAMTAGAELSFAAGAEEVHTLHYPPLQMRQPSEIGSLKQKSYGALQHGIFTAHQMGGLPMGEDPSTSVVNSRLQHHQINNLFVVDGSVFPTALGVNPSQTIYALGLRATNDILSQL